MRTNDRDALKSELDVCSGLVVVGTHVVNWMYLEH